MNTRARPLALRLLPALALTALGSGCVGHNHTLFVTKSNAGLDFDAKPPTTEITIARKEGVIAPSFEQGKTPPVMASFQAQTGHGAAFKSFFLGVDQTFAGGDAALVMATLYDAQIAPAAGAASADPLYDSAITVTDPAATAWWKKIPGPGSTNPFLFATDTLFGVKIGWSSVGQVPDSLKVGFNRKEFAWAPLSKTEKSGEAVKIKSPSFIATVDSDSKAGTDGTEAGVLQYFATGAAATRLALQPAVRRAMLSRMDPSFKTQLRVAVLGETLVLINSVINNRANEANDSVALAHKGQLAKLQGITPPADPGPRFVYTAATGVLAAQSPGQTFSGTTIRGLTTYNDFLESNRAQIAAAWQDLAAGKSVSYQADGAAALTDKAAVGAALRQAIEANSVATDSFRRQLTNNQELVNAYLYVLGLISPR